MPVVYGFSLDLSLTTIHSLENISRRLSMTQKMNSSECSAEPFLRIDTSKKLVDSRSSILKIVS